VGCRSRDRRFLSRCVNARRDVRCAANCAIGDRLSTRRAAKKKALAMLFDISVYRQALANGRGGGAAVCA
jgi:hypothetical protein